MQTAASATSEPTEPTARPATDAPKRIVLVGATITGNRGAESMLRAGLQRIPEFVPDPRFTLLSVYPDDDMAENHDPTLRIVPFSPLHMVLVALPLGLLAGLLLRMRLPYRFLLPPSLRALDDADLMIDLSGISFVDGRRMILIYNVLLVLLPGLLKTPVMKYSQALGPFNNFWNRCCAKWLLPKVNCIAARGRVTREHLDRLGLSPKRLVDCADAAFAMRIGHEGRDAVRSLLESDLFARPVIGISASSVVDKLCRARGIDYPGAIIGLIRYLIDEKGYNICVLAHSARPGRESRKNNDIPVCRGIVAPVDRSACVLADVHLNAQAQRALISAFRFLIAARFHAMISGLAMQVPTMQVGWSHKYAEVLEMFELEAFTLDYGRLTDGGLREMFDRLEREEADINERIARHLPAVEASSLRNAEHAAELLATCSKRVIT